MPYSLQFFRNCFFVKGLGYIEYIEYANRKVLYALCQTALFPAISSDTLCTNNMQSLLELRNLCKSAVIHSGER